MTKKRPRLYWRSWRLGGPGLVVVCVVLASDGLVWLALGLVSLVLAGFFGPWLLAPYSKTARRIKQPSDESFERSARFSDWLGSVPVFGILWRGAGRMTGDLGRAEAEAYRRWLREQDDDAPST